MVSRSIENPTVLERFVLLIPLPYPLAALFWSAVVLGPFWISAIQYVTTGSTGLTTPGNLPNELLNILLTSYALLIVRYMRLRVVAAEALIAPGLSEGEKDYHQAFKGMTATAPVIPLAATIGSLLLASYVYSGILRPDPLLIGFNIVLVYVNTFAFATYIWEFATASLGLYKLGGSSLQLGSFLGDRMMGAKPMGNLALSLTVAYFGGLLLTALLFSTLPLSSIPSTAIFFAFILLGVALFFLPLTSIHAKMQAEKQRLQREIGDRYSRLAQDPPVPKENATLDDVRIALARVADLQELEVLDRKVASLPTWPFDIQVVSRLIIVVLSVTAALVARLVADLLHI